MDSQEVSSKIWNRTLGEASAGEREGDKALRALLLFHNEAMSAGVLHALGYFSPEQLTAAQDGYRFYGFCAIADLIASPVDEDEDLDASAQREGEFDNAYHAVIPVDDTIAKAFEAHCLSHPEMYAPL